jgi:dCMP deaminase
MANKWEVRYMELAKSVSLWSKDPGSKIGAVIVGTDGQILSTGYNGFPRKLLDNSDRLNDRETKLKYTIHAEMNCIYNASLSGISLRDSILYVYGLPICSECAKGVIQSGITSIVISKSSINKSEFWMNSWALSKQFFEEANINISEIDYE